jgi:Putative phage abortive infection protein
MTLRRLSLLMLVGAAIFLAVTVASGAGWNPLGVDWDFQNSGAFGDSFGPLSSMMASIAAISAAMAYLVQREELGRLKLVQAQEEQDRTKRDFESTFFNLLQLFRETVREIEVFDQFDQNPVHGRDALKRILHDYIGVAKGDDKVDKKTYDSNYRKFRDTLSHYFRIFYHILKYIDESQISDRKLYIRLLRATLTDAEIVLISLNCLHGGGKRKLTPLIVKHAMLHNISAENARLWRIVSAFPIGAFGDRQLDESGTLTAHGEFATIE